MSRVANSASRFATALSRFALCALGAVASLSAQESAQVGTPLVEIIAELRATGLTVIYSNALVPETLLVVREPLSRDPVARLEEVLRPHGLALERGPRGSWLIVAGEARAPGAGFGPGEIPPAQPSRPALESVVVTASRYAFARSTGASVREIDRFQLENAPTLGDDALRTTHSLPGLTSSGLTARVNVRGGDDNETLLLLDGVRLYEPFHLKDFQSLFGSISPRILDRVDVHAGAYPAQFGDRMSAVIEMKTIDPPDRRHHEIGLSTLTSTVLSSGRFAEGDGEWVTSLRRGNLDLLIDAANSDLGQPEYTDFFNRVTYAFDDGWSLTAGALRLDDEITLSDGEEADAEGDYKDTYWWVRLDHEETGRMTGSYLVSRALLEGERSGAVSDPSTAIGTLEDRRTFAVNALKADWTYRPNDRHLLSFGLAFEDVEATHDFASVRELPVPILVGNLGMPGNRSAAKLSLDDRRRAAYASYRSQPHSRLTAEIGLRWDEQSYPSDSQVSPRASALLDLGERTTLRASWGRFHQPQGLNELQVEDGLTQPFAAQEAEHTVLSLEYALNDSTLLRAEVYRKEFERVRPRFENLFSRVSLLPELLPDRVRVAPLRGEAKGLELSLEGGRAPWQWWANFTRSSVKDRLANDWTRRSWEEPWSAKGGAIWVGVNWIFSGTLTLRSGWPLTRLELVGGELAAGPYNGEAFETFRSLDLRASRSFALKRGRLEAFAELTNALDFGNPCCLDYELGLDAGGSVQGLAVETEDWLPVIPTFGILWQL